MVDRNNCFKIDPLYLKAPSFVISSKLIYLHKTKLIATQKNNKTKYDTFWFTKYFNENKK